MLLIWFFPLLLYWKTTKIKIPPSPPGGRPGPAVRHSVRSGPPGHAHLQQWRPSQPVQHARRTHAQHVGLQHLGPAADPGQVTHLLRQLPVLRGRTLLPGAARLPTVRAALRRGERGGRLLGHGARVRVQRPAVSVLQEDAASEWEVQGQVCTGRAVYNNCGAIWERKYWFFFVFKYFIILR